MAAEKYHFAISSRSRCSLSASCVEDPCNDVSDSSRTKPADGGIATGVSGDAARSSSGNDWQFIADPKGFKDKLQFGDDLGVITVPVNAETKATYIANVLLHEIAHVVLGRNPLSSGVD